MTRPIIGSHYTPSRFERRDRNGTYAALRPEFSADASELQASYLNDKAPTHLSRFLMFYAVVIGTGVIAWLVA